MHEIEPYLRKVPGWSDVPFTITPIEIGITNRNYRVQIGDDPAETYVVRIPGERTEVLGINRDHEREAAERAAGLGIAPPVFGPLPGHTTLITRFVAGTQATDADFATPSRLASLVAALQRFHGSGPIAGQFPIHRVVESHALDAARYGVEPPPLYEWLHDRSAAIEAAFGASPMPAVPCHNDLLPANVLLDGDRAIILDFEYAGMNDVFFDLGNLSVNCGFDAEGEERLLAFYFGAVTPTHRARLELMKMMSEFREGMWAVVQQGISTLTNIDFVEYANGRLEHCRQLAEAPEFDDLLTRAKGAI